MIKGIGLQDTFHDLRKEKVMIKKGTEQKNVKRNRPKSYNEQERSLED